MERQFAEAGDEAAPSIFAKSLHPVTIKFENVVYRIKTKRREDGSDFASTGMKNYHEKHMRASNDADHQRSILKGVSGMVLPGEMLGLMGPSGSGKTTLLTALAGRLGLIDGSITYNGRSFSNAVRRNMGFVAQDDVLYPHLTVAETLVYTALLRLPSTLTRQEKTVHAESVMAQLGLTACQNSVVGGPFVRGVSGGERKRVSIGQEMLINPCLLLLDEPTSGMDSTTAQRIVSTLWELSRGGRAVLVTIHQPSSRLFYMFHKVLLLSEGSPVYFGRPGEAMDYFASIGYTPPCDPMNPAEFLLDLANGVSYDETVGNGGQRNVKKTLLSCYLEHLDGKVQEEIKKADKQYINSESGVKATDKKAAGNKWMTSWWEQFHVLFCRGLKERRHESFSVFKIAQVLILSIVCGCLWWQSAGHALDQVGLLFFISGFWGFFLVFDAIFTFPQERLMLTKERSSGMYRLSSYFMARIAGDLPMELLLPAIFTVIVYWMGGLKPTMAHFLTTLLVVLLSVLAAQGLGLAIGALIMDLKLATTLASVVMMTFMLAGGYFVQQVPPFIAWIKYTSLNFYGFKLLAWSQYSANETYECGPHHRRCEVANLPSVQLVGLHHEGAAIIVMLCMLFLYRLIAYAALTRVGVATR